MKIQVLRKWPKSGYIIGQMFVDGKFFCHTLEPSYTASHPAIPKGSYNVQMYPSGKFKGLRPILLNVPGRSGILIHEGNYPKDTQGCILVGKNTVVGAVMESKATLNKLIPMIQSAKSVTITIS